METGYRLALADMEKFSLFIENIGKQVEEKSLRQNKYMRAIVQESKKDLVDMMDEAYQDAFNIEIKKGK